MATGVWEALQSRPASLLAPAAGLTSGGLQPLVFDAVSDLGFGVALRKVTGDDRRVPLIHFNHVLHV